MRSKILLFWLRSNLFLNTNMRNKINKTKRRIITQTQSYPNLLTMNS